MKKNFLTLLTFALVLVNLALTAILAVAIIPEVKNANALIVKVADAIELDLQSTDAAATESYPPDQVEVVQMDGGQTWTVNLKKGEDGEDHYAVVSVSLVLNTKSDLYKTNQPLITQNAEIIKSRIISVISNYSYEEIRADEKAVLNECLQVLQNDYGKDLVVEVLFTSKTFQ